MYNHAKRAVTMHVSPKSPQNYKKIPIPPNFADFQHSVQHSVSELRILRVLKSPELPELPSFTPSFFQKYFGRLNFFL